jgi:hypothetical protein
MITDEQYIDLKKDLGYVAMAVRNISRELHYSNIANMISTMEVMEEIMKRNCNSLINPPITPSTTESR